MGNFWWTLLKENEDEEFVADISQFPAENRGLAGIFFPRMKTENLL